MQIKIDTSGEEFHAIMLPDGRRDDLFDRAILSRRLDELFREIYSDIRHDGKTEGTFLDYNGHKIGYWSLNDEKGGES